MSKYKLRINFFLKCCFWVILARPLVYIIIGLNIRNKHNLPEKGPCIIVANHNSHLDTLVIASLFPIKCLNIIRPVAAADYFLKNKFLTWFSLYIIGIIPIQRKSSEKKDLFSKVTESLNNNEIIIIFPEGSRGKPEQRQSLKKGISYLSQNHPSIPIIPIFMHGLGKSLPKGESLLVPFFCDVFIGKALTWQAPHDVFLENLEAIFKDLSETEKFPTWD